jgi:hypothetical protein
MTTDSEVIKRSRDSPREFGDLFHRHHVSVYRYIARRAGAETADEVMAQTFLIAFERRDRFDHTYTDARPWLFGIATGLLGAFGLGVAVIEGGKNLLGLGVLAGVWVVGAGVFWILDRRR